VFFWGEGEGTGDSQSRPHSATHRVAPQRRLAESPALGDSQSRAPKATRRVARTRRLTELRPEGDSQSRPHSATRRVAAWDHECWVWVAMESNRRYDWRLFASCKSKGKK